MFDDYGFWSVLWSVFWIFALVAYLFALFSVIADLFSDHQLSGWWKAVWVFCLVFVPFLTVLVYLIARGPGMQERAELRLNRDQRNFDDYIRKISHSTSPADEITKARALLDQGTISPQEYEALKARALGQPG
ncbi:MULTISPECIES: SHOCT domain-containing protein [unclassified Dietzia]|uniref:SHOCT domain-containing protein n=1 Tax=unclassified Dietzia TaxID=2617939 RepID=UPI000D202E2F|nr:MULTISPECIES: SHOCT domain-containing protein [unclassified Dietzia]AVZ40786.1 hypothetical protein CT688_16255 [Dietzia sp. JS16-p6b]MBB1023592.1 SHOCT domain-containing protein [Dietzia sp. DQ12-76]MBB1028689.1 SHOCT domain-containing protein [Dietzia sp. DQ11-38-2]QGW26387.1 hypothetical protein GJR88_05144 [Dietzia sp. DQ12-45-1b]